MTRPSDIPEWSAAETARRIREREIGCVEVTQAHLARMATVNPAINAVVESHAESALEQARAMDALGPDAPRPALFGVPVTTKINVDQAGSPTSNGVPAFNGTPAREDAPVVANLRAAGAIILGRTSTPEFSMRWFTSNPIHGVSLNPWDAALTPGGSSGAAAAAVACGIGAIAHGNDLGGSLRYPAYCCGIAAIRPSLSRVPAFNPSQPERPPLTQLMSVQGPLARSVDDLRLGLGVMARGDGRDPLWAPMPEEAPLSGRIGLALAPFGDTVHRSVARAMEIAVDGLRAAAFEAVETEPPEAPLAAKLWGDLLMTETKAMAGPVIEAHGSAAMKRVFDAYQAGFEALDLAGFLRAMSERIRLQRRWSAMFGTIDALVMPVSGAPPFANDLDFKSPEEIPRMLRAQKFLYAVNLLGLPSVAVPVALIDGVPTGVQIIAPMGQDAKALTIAARLERAIGRPVAARPPAINRPIG